LEAETFGAFLENLKKYGFSSFKPKPLPIATFGEHHWNERENPTNKTTFGIFFSTFYQIFFNFIHFKLP